MRAAALLIAALTTTVAAEPRLVLTHEPPPRTLKMRPRIVAQVPPPPGRPSTTMPAAPPPLAAAPPPSPRRTRDEDPVAALRDLGRTVSFSIDLGYQVDAATPSGRASLGSRAPIVEQDFAKLRAYGFGEVFGSTRGLGLASLSTYFAIRFQAARRLQHEPMPGQPVEVAPPIATWFERSGRELRAGWAEVRDFLPTRWGLSRVRVRAGSQHVYGPWVTHLDGAVAAYDGAIVKASGYGGVRHSDYTRVQSDKRPFVAGGSLRIDLRGLPTPLPIAIQGEYLAMSETRAAQAFQPASRSALLQGDWRPRRDIALIGQLRTLDGKPANQRLEVRARYKQVTNFVLDVMRRTENDWRWDPSLVVPDADPTAAKRYLDLGPVVPQLIGSIRAGTLIAENIDLLIRSAFAADVNDAPGDLKSSFAAPYFELGGALELRLRRTVAIGASVLSRDTHREPVAPVRDMAGVAQPLPMEPARGEEGFTEVGGTAKMNLGARRFSSMLEVYGRRTRYAVLHEDPILPVLRSDVRFGARITLDAWLGNNLRMFAAYDVSSAFDFAPEISGYRSLRLMMSGVY